MVIVLLNLIHLLLLIYFPLFSTPLSALGEWGQALFPSDFCCVWSMGSSCGRSGEGGERSKYLFFWLINLQDDSDWLWKVHGFLKAAPSMGLSIRVLVTELSHSFGQGYGKSTTAASARALHNPVASLYPIHCFLNCSFVNYLQIYLIWGCSLFSARPVVDTLYVFLSTGWNWFLKSWEVNTS